MPHRYLRLESLSILPISIRRFATPAANGSLPDLQRLVDALEGCGHEDKYTHSLPVFYSNLDPARIPNEESLTTDNVKAALLCFDGLQNIDQKQQDALSDDFAHQNVTMDALFFVRSFRRNEDARLLIDETVGVRALLMEAWILLLESKDPEPEQHPQFPDLAATLRDMPWDEPAHVAEVVDGCGGVEHFALRTMQTINIFVTPTISREPDTTVSVSERTLLVFKDILPFFRALTRDEIAQAFVSANVHDAVMSALVACTYSRPQRPDTPGVVLHCFDVLFELVPWPHVMKSSLRIGLLGSFIYAANLPLDTHSHRMIGLRAILTKILPALTVHPAILLELEKVLPGVEKLFTPEIRQSWIFEHLHKFMTLAHDRIELLNQLRSNAPLRACDNMDVGL
ncbi:hypothetical protein B0H16DRAFT_1715548 [Mycena metata]|uniref:Uncharacterized protein n=1 Tax=Mycena metata TaxID=1033252 RepID=A0AAD7JQL4_9AGAR|nr:hypothetical protein B0H16DRAFT_1715548 [Mycena metata]